jgi:hypothetical protein
MLEDGTPEILCGGISKIQAEMILEESYPEDNGTVVWLDTVRKSGKLKIVDGQVIK